MADLSACTVNTCYNLAVQNDTAAYSGSQSNQDYILRTCCRTFPCFSKCSYIRIISCFGRKSCQFCQLSSNFFKSPEKVYCAENFSFIINRSRNTDSNTVYIRFIQLTLFNFIQNCFRDIRNDLLSVILLACRNLPFLNQSSV